MECYHCGQENDEEAIYCKQCGLRIDGKMECPSCEKLVDSDSQFCGYCGCVLSQEQSEESDSKAVTVENKYDKGKPFGGIFALASAFFSLVFTFFIGLNTSAISMATASGSTVNLFYFFKGIYAYLDTLKDSDLSDFAMSTYYFYAVIGTLLAAAIILTVCIFFILTIVKCVTGIKNKSNKSYYCYALSTYLAYITGVALFYAFDSVSAHSYYGSVHSELTSYTVIGVVVSTACIIFATVSNALSDGNALRQKAGKYCFAILGLILLTALTVSAASPSIVVANDSTITSMSPFLALLRLATAYASKEPTVDPVTRLTVDPKIPSGIYSMIVIGYVVSIVMIVLIIALISKTLKNVSCEREKNDRKVLIISIALSVITIIYLIIGNVANSLLANYVSEGQKTQLSTSVVPYVVIMLLSLAYTVIAICNTFFNKNKRCEE